MNGGAIGQKLMIGGRAVVLEIVQANLQAQHRITPILKTLKIPSLTKSYYPSGSNSQCMIILG